MCLSWFFCLCTWINSTLVFTKPATQLCADPNIALYELQFFSAAASVHSHKLVLNADKSRLCIFYYYQEKACADCHGSYATASAQCHHMLDCLFWGGEMCNQIKTTYTPSLCFVFQRWVACYVHWLPHEENYSGQLGWTGGERQKSLLK